MNILLITPFQIILAAITIVILYISAILVLFKAKSGILSYLILILVPILGALGIIFGNYGKKIK